MTITPLKSHEVRVGNLVHYHHYDGATKEVCVVTPAIIQQIHDGIDYHPIPLLEGLLIKSEFKRTSETLGMVNGYRFGNIIVLCNFESKRCYLLIHHAGKERKVELNYVHELQNLFFDFDGHQLLQGEPLTFK